VLHAKLRNRTCQGLDRQGQRQGQGPSLQGPGQGQGLDLQGQGLTSLVNARETDKTQQLTKQATLQVSRHNNDKQ